VEGTLSVQPQANLVKGFQEYFLNLTVENNPRNPWFVGKFVMSLFAFIYLLFDKQFPEFWEDHFECRYPNSSKTPFNQKYTTACTTQEKLTKNNTNFEDQLQFVSDAVMAFAYALK
jgi:metabotropic X receptor